MYVATPPPNEDLVREFPLETLFGALLPQLGESIEIQSNPEYLHWDKLRHLEPPEDLSARAWWLQIKLGRVTDMRSLPITGPDGRHFTYCLPDQVLWHLHRIDQRLASGIGIDSTLTSDRQAARRFLVNARMEEAIRSSQLEGATTSRQVAQEMLRSGRAPKDLGERMVANNYRALQFMREEIGDRLTPEAVLDLHRVITDGTLDDPSAAGRLQLPGEERVAVFYRDEDRNPIHRPPSAEALPKRLEMLCKFANESESADPFVPPVVRAILVHFWLAYDHPFLDGNGRTARILFFWVMRSRGYRLAEYLPISRLLRTAPAQYTRAFLETETDEGDTTYFLLHQLRVIEQAIEDLEEYLQRKRRELQDVRRMLNDVDGLNGRQIVLLTHAIKHPDHVYTLGGHGLSHRVTHETARADLGGLADRDLLVRRRRGRSYEFRPASDLPQRLKESAT
jgi:Fic family protein